MRKGLNFITYIFIVILSVGMVACSSKQDIKKDESGEQVNNEEVSETTEEEIMENMFIRKSIVSTEDEGEENLFEVNEDSNILFVGNSLFNTPQTFFYFQKIIEENNFPLNVMWDVLDGTDIKTHLNWIEMDDELLEDYGKADIIIFQEYGNRYDTTYEDICAILETYCKEDVLVYYYTTAFDYCGELIEKITEDDRMHVIDYGTLMERLDRVEIIGDKDGNMGMEFLYIQNDYHPNELNGFMAAAYIYNQLYRTTFDKTYDELDENMKCKIPGDTEEAKITNYNAMIEVINKGILGIETLVKEISEVPVD